MTNANPPREIKFRVWFTPLDWETETRKPGRMIHFDQLIYCDEYNHLGFGLRDTDRDSDGGGYSNLSANLGDFSAPMQFTGLKDRNGVEIFEGDIVKLYEDSEVVQFTEGCFGVKSSQDFQAFGEVMANEYAVIGNVHESPDLLK